VLTLEASSGQDSIVVNAAGGAGAQVRSDAREPPASVLPCELKIDVQAQHLKRRGATRITRVRC
jgi:hypothetical protein